jgi:hypothetical protein
MPETVDGALNTATVATQAEHSEMDAMREEKEYRRTVFTVRGQRQNMRGSDEGPQWKSQWSKNRGRSSGDRIRMTGLEAPRNRRASMGRSSCRTDCLAAVSRDAGVGTEGR